MQNFLFHITCGKTVLLIKPEGLDYIENIRKTFSTLIYLPDISVKMSLIQVKNVHILSKKAPEYDLLNVEIAPELPTYSVRMPDFPA